MYRSSMLSAAAAAMIISFPAQAAEKASASILGKDAKPVGTATFAEAPGGVVIRVELQGLPPGYKAMHIHAVGTCEDHDHGFVASKAHLNPGGKKHGVMNPEGPDAGDLPNIYVHADGKAMAEVYTTLASLPGKSGRAAILDADGAALVFHANPDAHMIQAIGGAGARIACGVIKAAP